jgi:hypothetical protein
MNAVMTGLPLWAMGTYAMYPGPQETAPVPVYILGLVVWGMFLWRAAVRARRAIILSSVFLVTVGAVIPIMLTLVSYHRLGLFWQGRYALPLLVGIPLMLGLAWDEIRHSPSRALLTTLYIALFVENVMSLRAIVSNYLPYRSLLPGWEVPNSLVMALLVTAGTAGLLFAVLAAPRGIGTSRQG